MQSKNKEPHVSVMLAECLEFFSEKKLSVFFEGTLGAGGHARALLEAHPEIETYIGCDRDPEAIELAKRSLAPWKKKVVFVRGSFSDLDQHLSKNRIAKVDGFFLTWEFHRCN